VLFWEAIQKAGKHLGAAFENAEEEEEEEEEEEHAR
jgi:hypothetical protein